MLVWGSDLILAAAENKPGDREGDALLKNQ